MNFVLKWLPHFDNGGIYERKLASEKILADNFSTQLSMINFQHLHDNTSQHDNFVRFEVVSRFKSTVLEGLVIKLLEI